MPFSEPSGQYPGAIPGDSDYGLASNNVDDQLASSMDNSQTTMTLDDASGFPTTSIVTIGTELIKYTGKSGNDLTGLTRGFDNTSAASHSSGASVDLNVAAHTVNKLRVEQTGIMNELGTDPAGSATDVDTRIGNLESPQYVTLATSTSLSNERTLNAADGLSSTDNGAGSSIDLSVSVADFAGSGLESDGGSPADLRIASAAAGDGLSGGSGSALSVAVADIAGAGLESDGGSPADLRIASAAAGNGLTGGSGSALAIATDGVGTDELDESVTYTFTTNQKIQRAEPGSGLNTILSFVDSTSSDEVRWKLASDGDFELRAWDNSAGTERDLLSITPGSDQVDVVSTLSFPSITGTPTFANHDHSEGGMAAIPNSGLANASITITAGDGISTDGDGTLNLGDTETYSIAPADFAGSGLTTSGSPANLDVATGDGIQISSDAVAANPSDFAGSGLVTSGSPADLDVNPGNGLEIVSDAIAIATDAIQLAELDTSITPTWTGGSHVWQNDSLTFRLQPTDVTADGGIKNSPAVQLRGKFDADTTTGVTSTNRDATLRHEITSAGGSPASQFDFDIAGTDQVSITDAQSILLHQSTANYTVSWNNPSSARTITIKDPGENTALVYENRSLTGGDGIDTIGDLSTDRTVSVVPGDFAGSGLTTSGSPADLDVGAGDGISTTSTAVQVDQAFAFTWTAQHDFGGGDMILPTDSAPTPTTEGKVVWDTNDDVLRVGDGASTVDIRPGNVSVAGTPADNQVAVWTTASEIEGDGDFTWNGSQLTVTNADIDIASGLFATDESNSRVIIGGPASDPGTTAVGNNEIIFWFDDVNDLVKFRAQDAGGDGLTGTLGQGGGTVSEDGTPVDNQVAIWTGSQTIEGDDNFTYDGSDWTLEGPDDLAGNLILQPGADTATSGAPTFNVDIRAAQGDSNPVIRLSESGRIEMGPGGASAVDTNLYRSASDTLKTDDSLVVGSTATIAGDTTFQKPTQNYLLTANADRLAFQGQSSGTAASVEVFTNDGDGSDDSEVRIWGNGTPGSTTDAEVLIVGWSTGSNHYRIHTSDPGTGSPRSLDLRSANNTNQLHLDTTGSIGILTEPDTSYDVHIRGTAGSDSLLMDAADVGTDGGTQNSPILTLRAKHDSDTSAGVTSASTDYDVEFVSQVASGAQSGHVSHTVGGTEAVRLQHDGHLNAAQNTLLGATGTPNSVLDIASGSITLRQTTANYTVSWNNPGAARTLTIPDPGASDTFVFEAATQTLTNKTLSGGTISGTIGGSPSLSGTWTWSGNVVLPTATTPGQTVDGSVVWDSDSDVLTVGDGTSRKTMVNQERTLTGGTGINAVGDLSTDRTISVDQAFSPTWTGTHDFSGGTYIFPTASAPTPTTEGQAVWDTDDDVLRVGDGASTQALEPMVQADYVTITTDAGLDNERTLNGADGISLTDNGAGSSVDVAVVAGDITGSGLTTSGSPANIDVGSGAGITVNANDVAVDTTSSLTITGSWTFENQTDAASVQALALGGNRATVADNDEAFLALELSDEGGNQTEFARLTWIATDVTDATEDGRIELSTTVGGATDTTQLGIDNTNLNLAQDQNIQASGTNALTFDSSGNVTHPQATTLTGDVTLQQASNNHILTGAGSRLMFEAAASGTQSLLGMSTADQDGTDNLSFRIFGLGDPTTTDSESVQLAALTDGANITEYVLQTTASNAGSHHPIKIESGGNTDQFVANTDGTLTLGAVATDDYKITGSGSVLQFQNTASGNTGRVDILPADADGSDNTILGLIGVSGTDGERMQVGAVTDGTNITRYDVKVFADGSGSVHPILFEADGSGTNDQFLVKTNGGIAAQFPNTTTGTGLVVGTNDGSSQEIQRDSSTLRHKHNIQTLDEVDPEAVLDIDPIRYTETPDGDAFKISFGAEHFESIGLGEGLAYDGQGRVAGFLAGSRVIDAAQQVVLQDHDERVASLEATVEALVDLLDRHGIDASEVAS